MNQLIKKQKGNRTIKLSHEEYSDLMNNIYKVITGNELASNESTKLSVVYNKIQKQGGLV
jgi:hypothetical protein